MNPSNTPEIALCPRCFCALKVGQSHPVNFLLPVQPQPPPARPPNQYPASNTAANPSPPPIYRQNNTPIPSPGPSTHVHPPGNEQDRPTRGDSRRSSSSSYGSVFSDYSINTAFAAELTAVEDNFFSQQRAQGSSPPPISSPPTEFSLALSAVLTSSPSTESSLTPSVSDEPPSTTRRWVVFRGRTPGVYTSCAEATSQTDGFPNAFMLAFGDPAAADHAYEQFRDHGIIPSHGRGPWVVFVGRQPGVFTSYEELSASVVGFPNNCYRCCESIEEGRQALDAFLARQAAAAPAPRPTPLERWNRGPIMPIEDSWWCCFAGAEPGVYHGLINLLLASPAPGGAHAVNSKEEGWKLWATYLAAGAIRVIRSSPVA